MGQSLGQSGNFSVVVMWCDLCPNEIVGAHRENNFKSPVHYVSLAWGPR